jgi:hypothetical protein
MSFQTQVNNQPAPACEGDFASGNTRMTVLAAAASFVAAAAGVTVGQFAWANSAGVVSSGGGSGTIGFVHREQTPGITTFLAQSSNTILGGYPVTMHNQGDFWDRFAAGATRGQKVFASYADGSAVAGTAGSPPTGGVVTGVIGGTAATCVVGCAGTASVGATMTGSISTTVLTITTATAGVLHVGDVLSGPGGSSDPITTGTTIVSFGTGTGGTGTYNVSVSQTSTSATVTGHSTFMDVTAISAGTLATGRVLTEAGLALGTTITGQTTGTAGSTGIYTISGAAQTTASAGFTTPSNEFKVGTVTGKFHVGDVVSGTGVTLGSTIVSQLTGTAGATGTYTISTSEYAGSFTATATSTVLDVTAVTSGSLAVGDPISGSGITSGTTITALGTGTGGTGSYTVSVGQQAASETITALGAVETAWYVASTCLAGELAKISTYGA